MVTSELFEPRPPMCSWCGLELATARVIATDACASCADGTPQDRVKAALQRWHRGIEGRPAR